MSLIPFDADPPETLTHLDEQIVERLSHRSRKRGLSQSTKDTYLYILRNFNQFLARHQLPLNEASLKLYFDELKQQLRASTLNLRKYALLKCIKAQVGQGVLGRTLMVEKVFEQIPTYQVDEQVHRDQCLNEDQVQQLLDVAPTAKTRLLIHFLFKSACRVTEAIHIRLIDCKPVLQHVRIHLLGKGNKERTIEIPKALYDEIHQVYRGKRYLFESASGRQLHRKNILKQIKRTGERIGLNISPHCLRHSRATDMHINKGISLTATSQQLGHADPSITAKMYVHDPVDYAELFALDRI
jgi:site-specific recombinase XerD